MMSDKEIAMKGSIRFLGGLLLTMGAMGGIENGAALLPALALAVVGLLGMYSGSNALKGA